MERSKEEQIKSFKKILDKIKDTDEKLKKALEEKIKALEDNEIIQK